MTYDEARWAVWEMWLLDALPYVDDVEAGLLAYHHSVDAYRLWRHVATEGWSPDTVARAERIINREPLTMRRAAEYLMTLDWRTDDE